MHEGVYASSVVSAVKPHSEGVTLSVRVKPRAARSKLLGLRDGALEVAVAAPPVDGEANAELVRTLASAFGLPRAGVQIAVGKNGRRKTVRLAGARLADVEAVLSELGID